MWIKEIGSWVGGAVVGILLTAGFDGLASARRGRRGTMSGVWWQVIPSFGQEPDKLDRITCRHTAMSVSAEIHRTDPASQTHRSWRFEGRVQGNLLYGVFFSKDAADLSYGTIQLHKDNAMGTLWKGTYSRVHLSAEKKGWTETVPHVPLEWRREAP